MTKALTDRFCASTPAGEYADGLNRGLIFIVRPSTAKGKESDLRRSWQLRIVYKGKRIKRGLGAYPVPTSLQAARRAAQDARQAIFEGGEPPEAVRAKKPPAALPQGPEAYTFGLAASQFLADAARPYKNQRDEIIRNRALKVHAAHFNDLPVDQVTPRAVASLLKTLKPETAVKTRTVLNRVFAFAAVELAQKGVTMRNPASLDLLNAVGYQPPRASQRKHQPAVDYKRMSEVMAVLACMPTISARCAELIILTAARSGAARLAQFSQIDLAERVWRVPPESLKDAAHRSGPLLVPLSDVALAIVERMRALNTGSPYIFAAPGGQPIKDTSLVVLTRVLRRAGGWTDPDSKRGIVLHGMRSSFRTWVEQTRRGDASVGELVMGHRGHQSAVESRYVRGDALLGERRKLLDAWTDHCFARSNVVPIVRNA